MAGVRNDEEHAPTLTITQARQGRRTRHMVWVLGISMALLVVGYAALWLVHAPGFVGSGGETAAGPRALQQAGQFQAPPPQPRESLNPQTAPTSTPSPSGKAS